METKVKKPRIKRQPKTGYDVKHLTELLQWYKELNDNPFFHEDIQLIEQDIKDGGQRFYSYIMATYSPYGD